MSPFVLINWCILGLLVTFVANEDEGERRRTVCLGFLEPLGNMNKAVAIADVVDHDGSNCVAVVPSGDGLKAFLPCLCVVWRTVSQICNLMLFSLILSILAPNSTPMVTSCFSRYRWSVYWSNMQDLPTPKWFNPYPNPRWWCIWGGRNSSSLYYRNISSQSILPQEIT